MFNCQISRNILTPVLIDITRILYRRMRGTLPTGIDRVCIEYVRHYAPRARGILCLGPFSARLSDADSRRVFAGLLDPSQSMRFSALLLFAKALLTFWIPPNVRGQFLFNTSHTGLENPHYVRQLRKRGARPIVMIHDLVPIEHPEYCRPNQYDKHITRIHCAINIAHGIIANSHHTLQALTDFSHQHQRPLPSTIVATLASGLPAYEVGKRPLARPYFVMLGTIEPRKNHWMILQLWRKLIKKMGNNAPRLIVIGRRGWESENVIDLLERCNILKGVVTELAYCSDEELTNYLHHAQALLFPSFAEGFGLPLCEALSLGTPVIASDLDVFHEVAGDVPDYADPLDGKGWEALITDYASPDGVLRDAQLERMRNFQQTSWAEHFARVDAMLAEL